MRKLFQAALVVTTVLVFVIAYDRFASVGWHEGKTRSETKEAYCRMALLSVIFDRYVEQSDKRDVQKEMQGVFSQDPFSNNHFHFLYFGESNPYWYLVSVGPDRQLCFREANSDLIQYDPTNGTLSGGDIIFSSSVSPSLFGIPKYREGNWKATRNGYERFD